MPEQSDHSMLDTNSEIADGAPNLTFSAVHQDEYKAHQHEQHQPKEQPFGPEANSFILDICAKNVGHPMGQPPQWMPKNERNPELTLQCASTVSNIYRLVLKEAQVIAPNNNHSYKYLDQITVGNLVAAMESTHLAQEIPPNQVKPGDVVWSQCDLLKDPGNYYRHIGFVGPTVNNGQTTEFLAYSNAAGILQQQILTERFGHYKYEHFLRFYLPNKVQDSHHKR